jgi:hypothetical protein
VGRCTTQTSWLEYRIRYEFDIEITSADVENGKQDEEVISISEIVFDVFMAYCAHCSD